MERRILIVADDRSTQELVALALSGNGFQIFTASNRIEGLFQLGIVQPHLVILDLDIQDTLQRIRALSPVPIIALIADDRKDGIKSLNNGADCFVTKPPGIGELCARVRASLRRI